MYLSDDQANFLFEFKRSCLKKVFSANVDQLKSASECYRFYTDFLGLEPPKVYIADGPLDGLERLCNLRGVNSATDTIHSAEFGVHESSTGIHKTIGGRVFQMLSEAKESVKREVGIERFLEVRNIVFRDLNFQIAQSVHTLVEKSLSNQLGSRTNPFAEYGAHPSFADLDWLYFYKSLTGLTSGRNVLPSSYFDFVGSGLFSGYFYNDFAVLIPVPFHITKNDNLVLHNEDEAAVKWKDGTELTFWNGVEVPRKLICHPKKVTAEDILQEENAEVRRCYQEKLGSERFGNLLGLLVLDEKQDRFGNQLALYRTESVDKIAGDYIYFAKVICPSTGRKYFLCVPPGLKSAQEAVSWTFGKRAEDYKPWIET